MTLLEIQQTIDRLYAQDNTIEAVEFANKIEKSLRENNISKQNPQAFNELSKYVFELYVFGLTEIPISLVERIISFNIIEALNFQKNDRNLVYGLEILFSGYPEDYLKSKMREKVLPALKKNAQSIGIAPLNISQDIPQATPSVQNWLEYYDRITGLGETSNFERSKFLSSNAIVQTLSSEEKDSLRKVIQFYDYLKSDKTVLYDGYSFPITQTSQSTPPPVNTTTQPQTLPSQQPKPNNTYPPSSLSTTITKKASATPIVLKPKVVAPPSNLVNLKPTETTE